MTDGMRNRYREGFVQGFRKAQADSDIEIGRLQEKITLLTRKLNGLDHVSGPEEINIGCRCGWTGMQSALLNSWDESLHCPKCGSDFAAFPKSADPVPHPWGGAF